jgi:hypothetical protein
MANRPRMMRTIRYAAKVWGLDSGPRKSSNPTTRRSCRSFVAISSIDINILDLPLEILQEILIQAVEVKGLKRGLRLQSVNRTYLAHRNTNDNN